MTDQNQCSKESAPTVPALDLHVNGLSMKLSAPEHAAVQKAGVSSALLTTLLATFGPEIAKILVNLIRKRMEAPVKFQGILQDLKAEYIRTLLAETLLAYKDAIGDKAEEWVEKGIEKLADAIASPPPSVPQS